MRKIHFSPFQAHERTCAASAALQPASLRPAAFSEHFFHNLGLATGSAADGGQNHNTSSSSNSIVRPKASSYTKFLSIDFTSPLGQYILNLGDGDQPSIPVNIDSLCTRYIFADLLHFFGNIFDSSLRK